ncbi:hypothetical protein HHL22_21750 [Hymenobacter sp. RP-2-7]|uniref:Uncharacterized protein n=1 Tax=Hymenobacter polaris TaxID=2682546 RepID=A0A7Y0AI77_9BACT|nr:hypothetical protein [Hymenobacter polaris]NML67836.1 hypothetical protein [Hymenobacter polaris]
MATANQPTPDHSQPTDPAQLGADQSPETSARDDSRDMSPVIAETHKDQDPATAGQQVNQPLGSQFDQQRQQSAANDSAGDVGQGQGQGRAADNGDEDRGYEQSGYRGGLGGSGGRESHDDCQTDTDANPYTGGYDGGGNDQPSPEQTKNLGLNTPSPTDKTQ